MLTGTLFQEKVRSLSKSVRKREDSKDNVPPVQLTFCCTRRDRSVFNRFCSTKRTDPSSIVIWLMERSRFGPEVNVSEGK